jgi:hypothetical protein
MRIYDNIMGALGQGHIGVPMLSDLSMTFDAADHVILYQVLIQD